MSTQGVCATPILQQVETPKWDVMICYHRGDNLVGPYVYKRNEIDLRLAIAAALDEAGVTYDQPSGVAVSVSPHYPEEA